MASSSTARMRANAMPKSASKWFWFEFFFVGDNVDIMFNIPFIDSFELFIFAGDHSSYTMVMSNCHVRKNDGG